MLLFRLVALVRRLLSLLGTIFAIVWPFKRRRRAVPPLPPDNELLRLSARSLADRIRRRAVNSEQVVRAFTQRILEVNRELNAVVFDFFQEALEEARRVDSMLDSGKAPSAEKAPLLGVPFTVKECFAVKGAPNTAGLVRRRTVIADESSTVVRRLCAAGGIVLAVTNVSELCLWFECYNRVYGRTGNPYDLGRTCGGSSGGEAAVVAAAGSPFGVGSDIGGSIRMPSFFCGVFGHKASAGLVPNDGQYPAAVGARGRKMLTTGPICRFSEDLELLLKLMASEENMEESVDVVADGDDDTPEVKAAGEQMKQSMSGSWQVLDKEGSDSESATMATRASASSPTAMSTTSSWGVLSNAASIISEQLSLSTATTDVENSPDSDTKSPVDTEDPRKSLTDGDDVVVLGAWQLQQTMMVNSLCKHDDPVDISSLRVVSIVDDRTASPVLQSSLDDELRSIHHQVEAALERRHGVKVERARLSKLRCTADLWSVAMSDLGGPDMAQRLYDLNYNGASAWRSLAELARWSIGRSNHTFIALFTALLDSSMKRTIPESKKQKSRQIRAALEAEVEELVGNNGVLLFPSHAVVAPRHDSPLLTPMNFAYTALFNLTGMPSTQCPLGLGKDGVPIGIQVAALHGQDRLTLAVARDLEEAFGGWVPPQ